VNKVLIANRGEIACRIIRACRDLGLKSVAVFSSVDEGSDHVDMADESICIGPGPAAESYLNPARIMAAAEISAADAIHPGYGFLSENAHFASIVEASGLTWIGPSSASMAQLSHKVAAKQLAAQLQIPCIPGTPRALQSLQDAIEWYERLGPAVLLKTACGGGGKGIRPVASPQQLESQWDAAWAESVASYGRAQLFMERELIKPRHIEIQIIADRFGSVLHLGERDCTIQRRRQKVVEEAPSPFVTPELREALGTAACQIAAKAGYCSAGTAEFLLDADNNYYFMEFNSRLQVEHTVTEMITGLDLVELQLLVAMGRPLPCRQQDISFNGHAIQWRWTAEDPLNSFCPSPGTISKIRVPAGPGVRVDGTAKHGLCITPYYDPLLAKIIVTGRDRTQALMRSARALRELSCDGIKHTSGLLSRIVSHPDFIDSSTHLKWLEECC